MSWHLSFLFPDDSDDLVAAGGGRRSEGQVQRRALRGGGRGALQTKVFQQSSGERKKWRKTKRKTEKGKGIGFNFARLAREIYHSTRSAEPNHVGGSRGIYRASASCKKSIRLTTQISRRNGMILRARANHVFPFFPRRCLRT